jgi:photosystem II stability/assembly factor-like uncharacterized protein
MTWGLSSSDVSGVTNLDQNISEGKAMRLLLQMITCTLSILIASSQGVTAKLSAQSLMQSASAEPKHVKTTITYMPTLLARWKTQRLDSRGDLNAVQFLDPMTGWIADDKGSLFVTTDGGTIWSPVKVNAPPGAYIRSLFFVSVNRGWVMYIKTPSDMLDYGASEIWIRRTSDGGRHWSTQYTGKALATSRLRFINQNEGWAVGERLVERKVLAADMFLIHTTDGGETWTDKSEGLNKAMSIPPNSDAINDMCPINSLQLLLLTGRRVIASDDGAHTWHQLYSMQGDEPAQTVMKRIGVIDNKHIWVAGGADSVEGMWGMLTRMEDDNSWVVARATGVFYNDMTFLSKREVLACGSIPSNEAAERHLGKRNGVILYSNDAGNSWKVVYRAKQSKLITALAAVDLNHIWAVGESGLVVHLESSLDTKPSQ